MDYSYEFKPYKPTTDLSKLPVLEVREIVSVEKSQVRFGAGFLVDKASLEKSFPDFSAQVNIVRLKNSEVIFHIIETDSYYYMKNIYDSIFPWKSNKNNCFNVGFVSDIGEVGDVSRIFTIDTLLDTV